MLYSNKKIGFIGISSLETYIRTANSFPVLTYTQEKKLLKKLFFYGDLNAAKSLILSHLRFVIHISRSYSGYGLLQADLIQEGNIGLMKAIRRFNPNIEVRLVSFAVHWIKSEIHEYVLRNWRIVKVATTKSQRKLFFNLRKNKKRLGWFNSIELEIVAKELGVSKRDVKEMETRMSAQDVTLSYSPYEDTTDHSSNLVFSTPYLEDKSSNFSKIVEADNWDNHNITQLSNALLLLDKRSQQIIKRRWLGKNKSKTTLQAIAHDYGISAERVRQIEKIAMQKLKKSIKYFS